MTRTYVVVYEWGGGNFSGYVPDIPGCIATAKTLAGIRKLLKSAVEAHLQWMHDDGEAIPVASAQVMVDMTNDAEFPQPTGYYVIVEKLEVVLPKKKRNSANKASARELTAA